MLLSRVCCIVIEPTICGGVVSGSRGLVVFAPPSKTLPRRRRLQNWRLLCKRPPRTPAYGDTTGHPINHAVRVWNKTTREHRCI